MKIELNARNRAHHFNAEPGQKILFAGLSQGVALPYECASGTCGTCRARRLSGEIRDCWPEAPGRKYLKHAEEFLMCQCTAQGDVSLEVASFVQQMDAAAFVPRAVVGRIEEYRALNPDVVMLSIRLDQPMEFDAGQFVMLQAPGLSGYRAWSMANYARPASVLRFVVKRKPGGGISDWLFAAARTHLEVEVFGPLGVATFYPAIAKNLLCIAGGSGIAGMMSILERAALDRYFSRYQGDVFFGVRRMDDAFLFDELSELKQASGDGLNIVVALSEDTADPAVPARYPNLGFDVGFVHEVAGRHMKDRLADVRAYLAGPAPAVDAAVRMLLMARVSTANIRYDKFS
jgi:toluene monooxygenase electron transfer component